VLKALFASVKKHESELVAGKEIQNLQKGIPLHRQLTIPLENASKHFGLNDNIIQISFQNLRRLGICDQGHDALNFVNREEMITFTDYGYSLCSLCVK
jgi:hypothetical protein